VLECWKYIGEIVSLSDESFYGYSRFGSHRSDLLVLHKGRAYFIEITTFTPESSPFHSLHNEVNRKESGLRKMHQLRQDGYIFHRRYPHIEVFGYKLKFANSPERPVIVEWKEKFHKHAKDVIHPSA
jgi:hypothetical protein